MTADQDVPGGDRLVGASPLEGSVCGVCGDGEQPGVDLPAGLVAVAVPEDAQPGLLQDILGGGRTANPTKQVAEQAAVPPGVQGEDVVPTPSSSHLGLVPGVPLQHLRGEGLPRLVAPDELPLAARRDGHGQLAGHGVLEQDGLHCA